MSRKKEKGSIKGDLTDFLGQNYLKLIQPLGHQQNPLLHSIEVACKWAKEKGLEQKKGKEFHGGFNGVLFFDLLAHFYGD